MSLVPYAANELSSAYKLARTYARYNRVPMSSVPGYLVNDFSGPAYKAAKTIAKFGYKAAKRVSKKAMKRRIPKSVGELRTLPSKTAPGRRAATDPGLPGEFRINGNLHRVRFPWPAYDNGTLSGDNLVARTRNNIMVKGLSVCHTFTCPVSTASEAYQGPLKVRWYLCQKRDGYYSTVPETASASLNSLFFKTNNDGLGRNRDFQNEGATTPGYDHAKICAPLNIDDQLMVITSREFILHGRGSEEHNVQPLYQHTIKEYFKINKRLTFETVSAVTPDCEIFAVYWIYPMDESQYVSTSANNGFVKFLRHDAVHWSEAP